MRLPTKLQSNGNTLPSNIQQQAPPIFGLPSSRLPDNPKDNDLSWLAQDPRIIQCWNCVYICPFIALTYRSSLLAGAVRIPVLFHSDYIKPSGDRILFPVYTLLFRWFWQGFKIVTILREW